MGLTLARHYLERGAVVAAFARRRELLQQLAAEFPDQVFCYALDVRGMAAMQHAANDFIARAGCPDVVIANAGVSVGTFIEYSEDLDVFQQVLDIPSQDKLRILAQWLGVTNEWLRFWEGCETW